MIAASVKVGPPTTTVAPPAEPLLAPAAADDEELAASNASPPPPQAASARALKAAPASRTGRWRPRAVRIGMCAHLLCPAARPRVSGGLPDRQPRSVRLPATGPDAEVRHDHSAARGRRADRPLRQLEDALDRQGQRRDQHGPRDQLRLVLPVEAVGDQLAETPAAG